MIGSSEKWEYFPIPCPRLSTCLFLASSFHHTGSVSKHYSCWSCYCLLLWERRLSRWVLGHCQSQWRASVYCLLRSSLYCFAAFKPQCHLLGLVKCSYHCWLVMYCVQDRDEAKRQLTAHQKIIEKHKEMIQKCINFTKMLLVEKVSLSCCYYYYYYYY